MNAEIKQTKSLGMAWVSLALVLGVVLMFWKIVLPQIHPHPPSTRGVLAPDFVLPVIDNGGAGSRIRLSDLRGKAVVLDFWASWCAPCREQAPIVDSIARRYRGRDVIVVGVDTGDEHDAALTYLQSQPHSYASVMDGGEVAHAYAVDGLPTLVVIDKNGRIVAMRRSVVRESELQALLDEALTS